MVLDEHFLILSILFIQKKNLKQEKKKLLNESQVVDNLIMKICEDTLVMIRG